jgi:hypothetical protein
MVATTCLVAGSRRETVPALKQPRSNLRYATESGCPPTRRPHSRSCGHRSPILDRFPHRRPRSSHLRARSRSAGTSGRGYLPITFLRGSMRVTIDSWTGPATQTDPAPTTIPPSDSPVSTCRNRPRRGQCLGRSERSCASDANQIEPNPTATLPASESRRGTGRARVVIVFTTVSHSRSMRMTSPERASVTTRRGGRQQARLARPRPTVRSTLRSARSTSVRVRMSGCSTALHCLARRSLWAGRPRMASTTRLRAGSMKCDRAPLGDHAAVPISRVPQPPCRYRTRGPAPRSDEDDEPPPTPDPRPLASATSCSARGALSRSS